MSLKINGIRETIFSGVARNLVHGESSCRFGQRSRSGTGNGSPLTPDFHFKKSAYEKLQNSKFSFHSYICFGGQFSRNFQKYMKTYRLCGGLKFPSDFQENLWKNQEHSCENLFTRMCEKLVSQGIRLIFFFSFSFPLAEFQWEYSSSLRQWAQKIFDIFAGKLPYHVFGAFLYFYGAYCNNHYDS